MIESSAPFAILAPVPGAHLDSGTPLSWDREYVCFGSNAWELFRHADELAAGEPVPVLFYRSHDDSQAPTCVVSAAGWYIGHTQDPAEMTRDTKEGRRPPSMQLHAGGSDDIIHWGVFWRVVRIRPLEPAHQRPFREFKLLASKRSKQNAPPRGPVLIQRPAFTQAVSFTHAGRPTDGVVPA